MLGFSHLADCFQGSCAWQRESARRSFLFPGAIPLCEWTTFVYPFICWWVFGLLVLSGYCEYAAVNIHVLVFVWTQIFSSVACTLRAGIAGSYSNSMFHFWGMSRLISKGSTPFYIPTSTVREFQFSPSLPTLVIMSFSLWKKVGVKWPVIVVLICISLMALSVLISLHTCHNVGELLFYNNGRERRHLLGRKVGKLQAVVMIHESGRKQGMRWSRCARALKVAATEWGTAPHLGWRAFEDVVWDLELELTLCPKQGHVVQSFQ